MRASTRAILPALVLLLLLPPATARAHHRPGPCDVHRGPDESVVSHMKRLITCATLEWEVRGNAERAICVADAESHLNPRAGEAEGKFLGLFQHSAVYWPDRYETWTRPGWELPESALSGRTNSVVTIRMVHENGWGPWQGAGDCFERRARGALR